MAGIESAFIVHCAICLENFFKFSPYSYLSFFSSRCLSCERCDLEENMEKDDKVFLKLLVLDMEEEQLEESSSSSKYSTWCMLYWLHFFSYISVRLSAELSAVLTRSRRSTKPSEQSKPRELSSTLGLYSHIFRWRGRAGVFLVCVKEYI